MAGAPSLSEGPKAPQCVPRLAPPAGQRVPGRSAPPGTVPRPAPAPCAKLWLLSVPPQHPLSRQPPPLAGPAGRPPERAHPLRPVRREGHGQGARAAGAARRGPGPGWGRAPAGPAAPMPGARAPFSAAGHRAGGAQMPWSQSTSRQMYQRITYRMSRMAKMNSATRMALVTGEMSDCMAPAGRAGGGAGRGAHDPRARPEPRAGPAPHPQCSVPGLRRGGGRRQRGRAPAARPRQLPGRLRAGRPPPRSAHPGLGPALTAPGVHRAGRAAGGRGPRPWARTRTAARRRRAPASPRKVGRRRRRRARTDRWMEARPLAGRSARPCGARGGALAPP